jgi:tetratricopeptide (TPR) repeat protein
VRRFAGDPSRAASGDPRRPGRAQPAGGQALLRLQRRAGNRALGGVLSRATTEQAPAMLQWGDHGPAVAWLQLHLDQIAAVGAAVDVDWKFGPQTDRAVRQFQRARGLRVDGIVGPKTAAAIDEALAEAKEDQALARKVFTLGARAYHQHDYGLAYDYFTRAEEIDPLPAITFSRAQALRQMGARSEEAIALYEAYLASGETARRKDAQELIAEVRGADPTGDRAADGAAAEKVFREGEAAYRGRDYAHAYEAFTRTERLVELPELIFNRAQALHELGGHEEEAIALYKQYLATGNPKRRDDAEHWLAELEARPTGEHEADAATAERRYRVGEAAFKAGRYGFAASEFDAARRFVTIPEIAFSEAQALRRQGGSSAAALGLFEEYLASGHQGRRSDAELFAAQLRVLGAAT